MDIRRVRLCPEKLRIPVGVFGGVEQLQIGPAVDCVRRKDDIVISRGFPAHSQVLLRIEKFWPDSAQRDTGIGRDIKGWLAGLAFFGRNEDDTVDTLAAVDGSGIRVSQD